MDKVHLKIKWGGGTIECGWCVEMCGIHNDFDKHCLLSQKQLIKEIYK